MKIRLLRRQTEMKNKKRSTGEILRFFPIAVVAVIAILYFVFRDKITADNIIGITPKSEALAVLFMMLLGVVKGLSVFCPFLLLEFISVLIFKDKATAILVNLAVIAASFSSAYVAGRISGAVTVDKLRKRYPKFEDFYSLIKKNSLFAVFAMRVVGVLPMDVVSMYFGASKISYPKYLVMSLLGAAPDLIFETIIGAEIKNYRSPAFWIAVVSRLAFTATTMLVYRLWVKKSKNKTEDTAENDE